MNETLDSLIEEANGHSQQLREVLHSVRSQIRMIHAECETAAQTLQRVHEFVSVVRELTSVLKEASNHIRELENRSVTIIQTMMEMASESIGRVDGANEKTITAISEYHQVLQQESSAAIADYDTSAEDAQRLAGVAMTFEGSFRDLQGRVLQNASDFLSSVADDVSTFEALSETARSAAHTFAEQCNHSRQEITSAGELTNNQTCEGFQAAERVFSQEIGEATQVFESAIEIDAIQQVVEVVGLGCSELASVSEFVGSSSELLVNGLGGLADELDRIVEVVDTIQPVLDAVDSMLR